MIHLPNMLMIGSAGRNVGKTELACRIIQAFRATADITGVKVTAITRKDGSCPRGGQGCGVCSSLQGDYCVTDESNAPADKDTGRLLAAGASKVFWLRVLKSHLEEGLKALLEQAAPKSLLVCESNSLRNIVKPGVFLICRDSRTSAFKSSAADVRRLADRIVLFDGKNLDLGPEALHISHNRWAMREQATAIVMAGGGSVRMGQDKTMLPVAGKPLIEHVVNELRPHFEDVIVSAGDVRKFDFLDATVVADRVPGEGPLMGLGSALEASTSELNLVVACDIPDVDMPFARRLLREAKDYEVVVPRTGSHVEPLFAVYRKTVVDRIHALIASGERRVRALFDHCRTGFVDLSSPDMTTNLNTMEDYRAYVAANNDRI